MSDSAKPCDACGQSAWTYLFSERGHDLGRCERCGLHYIADLPDAQERMTEFESGHFGAEPSAGLGAATQAQMTGEDWARNEETRTAELGQYVDLVAAHAPPGRWMDIGCGSGTLMRLIASRGIDVDGLELDEGRRALAARGAGQVFGKPLEDLALPEASYSAVLMVNVFSHLVSPMETLREIGRILSPGGVVMLHTSEIGTGVEHRHHRTWMLGDHLMFLGEDTIDHYADGAGLTLVERKREWQPSNVYSRARMLTRSADPRKNAIKTVLRTTPGLLPVVRWGALTFRERGNPMWESSLVLQKAATA